MNAAPVLLANTGTPLMWLSFEHLFVGNALIGVLEGALIALVFKVSRLRAILLMIVANYVSMIIGWVIMSELDPDTIALGLASNPLIAARRLILAGIFALLFLSIILEWPLCAFVLWQRESRWRRGLAASAIAQLVSFLLILPMYWVASSLTVLTQLTIDEPARFARGDGLRIWYIDPDDRYVYRAHLDGSNRERVVASGAIDRTAQLVAQRSDAGAGLDLALLYPRVAATRVVLPGFAVMAGHVVERDELASGSARKYEIGPAADLRPESERDWSVWTGFWAIEGVMAANEVTGETRRIALETPFIQWPARNATVLPGDQVVYELGDWIVLLDLPSRRIGVVCRGYGSVVSSDVSQLHDSSLTMP